MSGALVFAVRFMARTVRQRIPGLNTSENENGWQGCCQPVLLLD